MIHLWHVLGLRRSERFLRSSTFPVSIKHDIGCDGTCFEVGKHVIGNLGAICFAGHLTPWESS